MTTTISNIVGLAGPAYLGPTAASINDQGQVVGYSGTLASGSQPATVVAVEWQGGKESTLTGLSSGESDAYWVNDLGQVVGTSTDAKGNSYAALWQNGTVTNLGSLVPAGVTPPIGSYPTTDYSYAFSLNDLGQIVGTSSDASGNYYPTLWQNGTITNLGTLLPAGVTPADYLAGYGQAQAINNAGQIVGDALATSTAEHAFLWQDGKMSDLGVLPGGLSSSANAINNSGLIVGGAATAQKQVHAVEWQNGKITDLGTLAGYANCFATGVSDSGIIVGEAFNTDPNTGDTTTERAVIWQNGVLTDLNSLLPANSGWVLNSAVAINNKGQITGDGTFNGAETQFVITLGNAPPVTQTVQAVLQSYKNGQLSAASPVFITDSAANIQANLDALQPLAVAGDISDINFSDSGAPTLSVTKDQLYYYDGNALGYLTGKYSIAITDSSAYGQFLELDNNDSRVISVAINDSANAVLQNLDDIQALVNSGRKISIALTDSGTPPLTLAAAQLTADAGALETISGPFTVSINASAANLTLAGVAGHANSAVFSGQEAAYSLSASNGAVVVTDTGTGRTSVDHLSGVQQLDFSDHTITVTAGGSLNEYVALLYQAALGRTPDAAGLVSWQALANALPATTQSMGVYGLSDASGNYNGSLSIAGGFTNSAEFVAKYGSLSNTQFVTQLYANVLDRPADSGGLAGWVAELDAGQSREHVLIGFAESAEAIANATKGYTGQSGAHATWLFLT